MSIEPSDLNFFLKIHLLLIGLQPLGRLVNSHVLFVSRESISLLIASFQKVASIDFIALIGFGIFLNQEDGHKFLGYDINIQIVKSF